MTVIFRSGGSSSSASSFFREPAAPDEDRHAERLGAARHFLADAAEAEQTQRAAVQTLRLRVLLLVPLSRAQFRDVIRNTPVEREHEAEGQLRHGNGVLPGTVGHVDSAFRCARHIDRVHACAGTNDERQVAGIEHRLGDLGRSHDEYLGL
jgi:hypothetical protein